MFFIEIDRNTKLYLVSVFAVSYCLEAGIILGKIYGAYTLANLFLILLVFTPATIAGIMVNMFGEPPYFLRTKLRNVRFLFVAYAYPLFLIILAAILLDLLGFDIDWGLTAYKAQLYWTAIQSGISPDTLYEMMLISALAAPIVNSLFALGEEVGWRGYLLDKLLARNSLERVIIFIGTIWALWHAPLIAILGYNYKSLKALGLLLFIPFCISHGAILIWLRIKTESILTPALGHGAINAFIWYGVALHPEGNELLHLVLGIPGVLVASILGFIMYRDLKKDLVFIRLQ